MTAAAEQTLQDWLLDASLAPASADDALGPLYAASKRGELALPFCAACALPLELDQQMCDGCGSCESDWRTVDLSGRVHSATMMHRLEPGLVRAAGPYPVVDVELTCGHRIVMTTAQPTDTPPDIGSAVRVSFRRLGEVVIPAVDVSGATDPGDGTAEWAPVPAESTEERG